MQQLKGLYCQWSKHKHLPLLYGVDRLFPLRSSPRVPSDEDAEYLPTPVPTFVLTAQFLWSLPSNSLIAREIVSLLETATNTTCACQYMGYQLDLKINSQRLDFESLQGTDEVDTAIFSFQLNAIGGIFRPIVPAESSIPLLHVSNHTLDLAKIRTCCKYLQGFVFKTFPGPCPNIDGQF